MLNYAVIANCACQICTLKTQEQQSHPGQCSPWALPPQAAFAQAMAQLGASVQVPLYEIRSVSLRGGKGSRMRTMVAILDKALL